MQAMNKNDAAVAVAVEAEREECAKIAEAYERDFLLSEYAADQPMSRRGERFACRQIATAIRMRSETGR